eukprot:TRINITY_DN1836_c0_g1_i1.p1 TRINITY_DN1836_c0_g1~~TRINITY_DN1836_c0_g1_i1.p1  ORF type:complete len:343 (+),score=37.65 TRINITY_DN1836_c0_g1_i1:63-1091(+)
MQRLTVTHGLVRKRMNVTDLVQPGIPPWAFKFKTDRKNQWKRTVHGGFRKSNFRYHRGAGHFHPHFCAPWWPFINKHVDYMQADIGHPSTLLTIAGHRRVLRIPHSILALPDGTVDQTLRLAYASHSKRMGRLDLLPFDPRHVQTFDVVHDRFLFDRPDWRMTVFGNPQNRLPVLSRERLADLVAFPEPDTFIFDLRTMEEVGPEGLFPTAHHFTGGAAQAMAYIGRSLLGPEDVDMYAAAVAIGPCGGATDLAPWVASPRRQPTRGSEIVLISFDGIRAEEHGILLRLDGHLGPIWNYRAGLNDWFDLDGKDRPAETQRAPHPSDIPSFVTSMRKDGSSVV